MLDTAGVLVLETGARQTREDFLQWSRQETEGPGCGRCHEEVQEGKDVVKATGPSDRLTWGLGEREAQEGGMAQGFLVRTQPMG